MDILDKQGKTTNGLEQDNDGETGKGIGSRMYKLNTSANDL